MIAGTRRFWIAALAVLVVLALKALFVTSWVVATVEDAAVDALAMQGLSGVDVIEIDGFSADGLDVVLAGPAADRAAAIAAVGARDEIDGVTYRPIDGAAPAEVDPVGDDGDAIGVEEMKGPQS